MIGSNVADIGENISFHLQIATEVLLRDVKVDGIESNFELANRISLRSRALHCFRENSETNPVKRCGKSKISR